MKLASSFALLALVGATLALPVPAAEGEGFRIDVSLPFSAEGVLDKGDFVDVEYDGAPETASEITFQLFLGAEEFVHETYDVWHHPWGSTGFVANPVAAPGTYTLTAVATLDTGETATDSMQVQLVDENDAPWVSMFPPRHRDGVLYVTGFALDWDGHVAEVTLETRMGAMTVTTRADGYFSFEQPGDWKPGRHLVRVSGADDDGAPAADEETLVIRAVYFDRLVGSIHVGMDRFVIPAGVEEGRIRICWARECEASISYGQPTGRVRVNLDGSAGLFDEAYCQDSDVGASLDFDANHGRVTECAIPPTEDEREVHVDWLMLSGGWVRIVVDGIPASG